MGFNSFDLVAPIAWIPTKLANQVGNGTITQSVIDDFSFIAFQQSTADVILVIPPPTDTAKARTITFQNLPASTQHIRLQNSIGENTSLAIGRSVEFTWNGTTWRPFPGSGSGITNLSIAWAATMPIASITNDGVYYVTTGGGLAQDSAWGMPALPLGSTLSINGVAVADVSIVNNVWNMPYSWLFKIGNAYTIVNAGETAANVHWTRATNIGGVMQAVLNTDLAKGRNVAWQVLNKGITVQFYLATATTYQNCLDSYNSNSGGTALTALQVSTGGAFSAATLISAMPVGLYSFCATATTAYLQAIGSIVPAFTAGDRRWSVTTNNTTILSGSLSVMTVASIASTFEAGAAIATWDGTTIAVTTTDAPVALEALIQTTGTGNHSADFYFRNAADAIGVRFGDGLIPNGVSVTGIYGQASSNRPATAVIPPNTTVSLNIVHIASSGNQVVNAGSYLRATEVRSSNQVAINGTPQNPIVTDIIANQIFTRDPLCRYLRVQGVAGSGSGGYSFGQAGANSIYVGVGSGSGAYVDFLIGAADFGASQAITIGAAGSNGNGGNTLIGTLATAEGSPSGSVNYASCDSGLTSCSISSSATIPTFTLGANCRDIGSRNGVPPTSAHASIQVGSAGSVSLSRGGDSPFGIGARANAPLNSAGRLLTLGGIDAASPVANTGAGASGDCTYSTNTSRGTATNKANGSAGRARITQYF